MSLTRPTDWKLALLKQNPFTINPPQSPEMVVWAGLPRLKAQFEELFMELVTTSPTQVVLNWGPIGGGKTHAALYFSLPERWPLVEGEQTKTSQIIYVRTPKDPSRAVEIFYRDVIETLRFSRLRAVVRDIVEEHGKQEALKMLEDAVDSEHLGKAIWLLGFESNRAKQLELFQESIESDWSQTLSAYFFSEHTKSDLKKLGLSRSISSAQDRFRIIAGILRCLIGLTPEQDLSQHSRVVLWLDEMEDLIYFPTRQYRPFTQGLRDIVDRLPSYFTLMMNFTLASPEAFEDAGVVLGLTLMDRVTRQIYFREPDEKEAFEYVCDLLQAFRTEKPEDWNLLPTYPFDKETLKGTIGMLPERTPREINKRCSEIISKALSRGIISAAGEGIISMDFVGKLDQERLDLELR